MNPKAIGHHDPFDYFPLKTGLKPSQMGIKKITYNSLDPKTKVFQFDSKFHEYNSEKLLSRESHADYYQHSETPESTTLRNASVLKILTILEEQNPSEFKVIRGKGKILVDAYLTGDLLVINESGELDLENSTVRATYIDSFDALSMNLQEDLVVQLIDKNSDYTSTISLYHANGWSAQDAINQTFMGIHSEVERINKIIPAPLQMFKAILNSPLPFERVAAISFRTDSILNRHPKNGLVHKPFTLENQNLFIRVERQTVVPVLTSKEGGPEGFLFTIKTYFMNCAELSPESREKALEAFEENSPDVYSNSFIDKNRDLVIPWLKTFK